LHIPINQLTNLPPELIQLDEIDLLLLIHSNRLCSTPDSIGIWIDEHVSSSCLYWASCTGHVFPFFS